MVQAPRRHGGGVPSGRICTLDAAIPIRVPRPLHSCPAANKKDYWGTLGWLRVLLGKAHL